MKSEESQREDKAKRRLEDIFYKSFSFPKLQKVSNEKFEGGGGEGGGR